MQHKADFETGGVRENSTGRVAARILARDRKLAALGYFGTLLGVITIIPLLGVLSLVPILASDRRKERYAYFHGRQAFKLWIWEICAFSSNLIPVIGHIIWVLSFIFCLCFSIAGIWHSLRGNYWKLPLGKIGDII